MYTVYCENDNMNTFKTVKEAKAYIENYACTNNKIYNIIKSKKPVASYKWDIESCKLIKVCS